MKIETLNELCEVSDFTVMCDESAEQGNREQLSLHAHITSGGNVKNLFWGLICLMRFSILEAIEQFFSENDIDIIKIRFSGMDGCSTMSGEGKGLKTLIE